MILHAQCVWVQSQCVQVQSVCMGVVTVCVGVVKSEKGNNVNGHNWNGLEYVHKVCNYLDFSSFSVQITHYL